MAKIGGTLTLSFGLFAFRRNENWGRIDSKAGGEAELKALHQSIMRRGMDEREPVSAIDITPQDIADELEFRALEYLKAEEILAKAEAVADPKKEDKANLALAQARLDVMDFYWKTKSGKYVEPDYTQITGNQRGSVYIEAMADRLATIRQSGWSSDKLDFPPLAGLDSAKVQASDVCQSAYEVRYRGPLTHKQIVREQYIENGLQDFGTTPPTEFDTMLTAWELYGDEPLPTEAKLMAEMSIKRGVAQHVHRFITVEKLLQGSDYSVVERLRLPHGIKDQPDDLNFRNPLVYVSNAVDSQNPKDLLILFIGLNPDRLKAENRKLKIRKQAEIGPSTQADLIQFLEDCHFRATSGDVPERGVSWKDAEEFATSTTCKLLSTFVAACREGKSKVSAWLAANANLIQAVEQVESDYVVVNVSEAEIGDEIEESEVESEATAE